MSANLSHKIVLKKHGPRHFLEFASSAILSPGHLVEVQADGTIQKHGVVGGRSSKLIAYEDVFQGKTINDAFASGDMIPVFGWLPGDELMLRVAAGQPAVLVGANLGSDGAGGVTPIAANGALYQNTGASNVITNTVTPTAFNLTYTYPANTLKTGDAIKIVGEGTFPSTNSTDTAAIAVLVGATTILTIPALDVANGDIFRFAIDGVVTGVSGTTATVAGTATYSIGPPATATVKSAPIAFTFNNTVTQAITVQATWSVANAGNQVRMDFLTVSGKELVSLFKAIDAVDNSGGSVDVWISGRAL